MIDGCCGQHPPECAGKSYRSEYPWALRNRPHSKIPDKMSPRTILLAREPDASAFVNFAVVNGPTALEFMAGYVILLPPVAFVNRSNRLMGAAFALNGWRRLSRTLRCSCLSRSRPYLSSYSQTSNRPRKEGGVFPPEDSPPSSPIYCLRSATPAR